MEQRSPVIGDPAGCLGRELPPASVEQSCRETVAGSQRGFHALDWVAVGLGSVDQIRDVLAVGVVLIRS